MPSGERRRLWLAFAAVLLAGAAAYGNSLAGPFLFDDLPSIAENARLHGLAASLGGTARPVLMLTLAGNYAAGRLAVQGYHLVNVAIHLLAALLLFAIVRRTLLGSKLRGRYGDAATGVALASALLWVAHPLTTQAVTYVTQRGESLASFFYVATLYATIRGAESNSRAAYVLAVLSCLLGAATKPVVVSAPLVIALYDRWFLADSFAEMRRRRGWLYAGLACVWVVALVLARLHPDPGAGPGLRTVTSLGYALSQPGVVLHYLRLSAWPRPLVLDYDWDVAHSALAIVPPLLLVVAGVAGVAWLAVRRNPLAFPALWTLLVLAPTSSVFPINDLAVEHRMYLPLAGITVLAAVGGYELLVRRAHLPSGAARLAVFLACIAFVSLTRARNTDYRSEVGMWSDVTAKRPLNGRGFNNLGRAWIRAGDLARAVPPLEHAVEIAPRYPLPHNNLGAAFLRMGQVDRAIAEFRQALAIDPGLVEAHYNLGQALAQRGDLDAAIAEYGQVLKSRPTTSAWIAIANTRRQQGRTDLAIPAYRSALAIDPASDAAWNDLGLAQAAAGDVADAIASATHAVQLAPQVPDYRLNLGNSLLAAGRFSEAVAAGEAALRLAPDSPPVHNNLGLALVRAGRPEDGAAHFREALRLAPEFEPARRNLESLERR